eukprot:Nitzschia sp. Nitz4//scaffold226_size53432//42123//42827//NITZ4_006706-RA/size53432-processed-gene-0.68-mRNA-1//1//CDS//3329542766//9143//frame0
MARQTQTMFNGSAFPSVAKDGCVPRRNGLKRVAPLSLPLSGKYHWDVKHATGDLVKAALLIESGIEGIKVEETKSVSFDLSQNQEIEPENELLSPEEISQCWWTADFYDRALYQCKKDANSVLTTEQESAQLLRDTVSLCNQSSCDRLENQSEVSAMLATAMIPRGVEKEVITEIRQMRRKHVRSVLEYSQKIPRHLSLELRERMLSARSLQFSRAHRILARLLGEADVVVRSD